ncbi:MAG: carboxypeptidase-like regulatory domain-containing protein, partial [Tannerellaceae bacterium]|nr:carboxypeptidase-like regulatory domain-containing protein [Tannerellaceae bacterium]
MRIIFSLLIIALPIPFLYAEAVYGQALKESNITCTVKGAAITDVFSELNRQTGFHFFYDESVIADVSTVTIHIENGSMDSILRELTRQTGLQFKKIDQTISVSKNLPGVVIEIPATDQTRRQISGIVTDESGEPVIGANIVEKGTTNGTITDMDGRFTLSIEPKALLVISYIGYITQEVEVGDQITLSVALGEDSQSLDEVVVVGYG